MVNSIFRTGACANRLLFSILFPVFLLSSFSFFSQNLSKHYSSQHQENGTLYFIYPQKGFHAASGSLRFDITYLSPEDSVVFNFSYLDKSLRSIDSIIFISGARKVASPVRKLFLESKGKKWYHRYSAKLTFNDLRTFFENKTPPQIQLHTRENSLLMLKAKKRAWKKISAITIRIFTLIIHNTAP
jgi:hypothetical protein